MIIKREEFPSLIGLIGLITSADFNQLSIVSDNQFQNLSRFPVLIYTRIIKHIFNKNEKRCMDIKTQKECEQGRE